MRAEAKVFLVYIFVIILLLLSGGAFAQISVAQFNAGWNSPSLNIIIVGITAILCSLALSACVLIST